MEPNELDKIFKDQIENDSSDLNFEELGSKNSIWGKLEVNQVDAKDTPVQKSNQWWKIVAGLLLLGLGTISAVLCSKLQTQNQKYYALENEYKQVGKQVGELTSQIKLLDLKMSEKLSNESIATNESIKPIPISVDTQYIEKTIYRKDTIITIQKIQQPEVIRYIKDTIIIKEVVPTSPIIATTPRNEQEENNTVTETKKPKKVEFVFGKKPIKKPEKKGIQFQLNGSDVARKGNNE